MMDLNTPGLHQATLLLVAVMSQGCAFGATGAIMASIDTSGQVGVETQGSGLAGVIAKDNPSTVATVLPEILVGVGYRGLGSRDAVGTYLAIAPRFSITHVPAEGASRRAGVSFGAVIPFRHERKAGIIVRVYGATYPQRSVHDSPSECTEYGDDTVRYTGRDPDRRSHDLGGQLAAGLWWTDDRRNSVSGEVLAGAAYQYMHLTPPCRR